MARKYNFVTGGAAVGVDSLLDLISETPIRVFGELAAPAVRRLKYISLYNDSATTTAHVKLFWKRQRQSITIAGTIGDGDYVSNFAHASLASAGVDVPTTRAGGSPADAAALGVQHEADIEGESQLDLLIANADDDGAGVINIYPHEGVRGLVITTTPPGSATMNVNAQVAPILTSDIQDLTVSVPAGQTVSRYLGDVDAVRLWIAATTQEGVGATAPDESISGFLVTS